MTTITDPILEPYHITRDNHGYSVYVTITPQEKYLEEGSSGKDYVKAVCHPSTFGGCLKSIAKLKTNTDKHYSSVRSYLDEFNEIYNNIEKSFNVGI